MVPRAGREYVLLPYALWQGYLPKKCGSRRGAVGWMTWDQYMLLKTVAMYRANFGEFSPHEEPGVSMMILCAKKSCLC